MIPVLLVFLALNLADVATTMQILGAGGVEANPVFRPLLDSGGYLVKLAVAALISIWLYRRRAERKALIVAWVGVVYLGLVVGWNTSQVGKWYGGVMVELCYLIALVLAGYAVVLWRRKHSG